MPLLLLHPCPIVVCQVLRVQVRSGLTVLRGNLLPLMSGTVIAVVVLTIVEIGIET